MNRWIWHLFFILLITTMSMPLHAQDNDDNDNENRFITINFSTLYDQNTPQLLNLIRDLQDNLPFIFENSNITPLIEFNPRYAAIQIMLDFAQDTVFVDFNAVPPLPTLLPSSYLIPHPFYNFPLSARSQNVLLEHVIEQFTIALSYYLNADCEGMLPYLDATEEIATQIEELTYSGETVAYLDFYRANCAIVGNDLQTAQTYYEDILTFFEDNGYDFRYGLETRINLAWTYYQLDETNLAYDMLNSVVGFTGIAWASVRALELRAYFYTLEGAYEDAIEDLDTALQINIDDPYLIGQVIEIFILMGDFKSAGKEITRLEKTSDGYPVILYYRGLLAYADGDNRTAEDYLSQFVAQGLNDYLTLQARALLTEIQAR